MYDRHLDAFLLAAEYHSFAKAGETMYISANAVMKQVNILERTLGVTLFNRTKRGVFLTEAGKVIFQEAKDIIALSEAAIEKAKYAEKVSGSTVKIGTSFLYPAGPVLKLWDQISERYPNIILKTVPVEDDIDMILGYTLQNKKHFDIYAGIYPTSVRDTNCEILDICSYPMCILTPKKHRLARKRKISFSDLYGETLFITPKGITDNVDIIRTEIERNHPQIKLRNHEMISIESFNQCELSNTPLLGCPVWRDLHNLVAVECDWDYRVSYGIVYPKDPPLHIRRFIDAINEVLENQDS